MDLPPADSAILRAIIAAPLAWSPAGDDADSIARLAALGLVERWSPDDRSIRLADARRRSAAPWVRAGDYLTLTPLGAALAGVRIQEEGLDPDEAPRWVERDADERPVRLRKEPHGRELARPELVVDPAPGPDAGPEVVLDEWSGEPLLLLGAKLFRDRRIKRPKGKGGRKGRKCDSVPA